MLDYQRTITFFAEGNFHFGDISILAKVTGSYKTYSKEIIRIKAWSENQQSSEIFDLSMRYPFSSWFEGVTESKEDILIIGIEPFQISGNDILIANVNKFLIGDINLLLNPGTEIKITGKLLENPIAIPEWRYQPKFDGTISQMGHDRPRIGISWENPNYSGNLIDNYEYVSCENENEGIIAKIRTNKLTISLNIESVKNIGDLLKELPDKVEEDFLLISFIGRRREACYEAEIRTKIDEKNIYAFGRFRIWEGFYMNPPENSSLKSLLKQTALREGLFNKLQNEYRTSEFNQVIKRTIPYLVTSYEDGYIETQLINAYAALESMVDGIGEKTNLNYVISSNKYKELAEKLKVCVHQFVDDNSSAEGIIKKFRNCSGV